MTRVAVTGARGRLGDQVVKLLRGQAGVEVVGLTRAVADYDDRLALTAGLAGVHTLVLVSSDGEADRVLQHHLNLVAAATANGVGHVVALSSVDADLASPFCYARVNALTERALLDSGCAVTAVRASIYTEFFETLLDGATVDGQLRLLAEDARVALVARTDVGRSLAACALLPPSGPLDVTGPAALDMAALAAARGASYVPVSEAEFAAGVAQRETPWWAYAYTSLFGSIREHRWEVVTDTVRQLTGESARPAV
jgi:NAD(P)H dehydrogenase (quinone)